MGRFRGRIGCIEGERATEDSILRPRSCCYVAITRRVSDGEGADAFWLNAFDAQSELHSAAKRSALPSHHRLAWRFSHLQNVPSFILLLRSRKSFTADLLLP